MQIHIKLKFSSIQRKIFYRVIVFLISFHPSLNFAQIINYISPQNKEYEHQVPTEGKIMNASLINKVNFEKSTISTDFESILRITWSPDSQYFAILQ